MVDGMGEGNGMLYWVRNSYQVFQHKKKSFLDVDLVISVMTTTMTDIQSDHFTPGLQMQGEEISLQYCLPLLVVKLHHTIKGFFNCSTLSVLSCHSLKCQLPWSFEALCLAIYQSISELTS